MNTLPANFPELMLLLVMLVSVFAWDIIKMILAAMAVGFLFFVMLGLAGYSLFSIAVG